MHYPVFNSWKLILYLEPLMGVPSVSLAACSSVFGITLPELCISHSCLVQATFPLSGIHEFSIGELGAVGP